MLSRALPFPFAFHVGTDVCHIVRIHTMLGGSRGPRFIRRVLAAEELAPPRGSIAAILGADSAHTCQAGLSTAFLNGGVQSSPLWEAAVFLAGRFAAKEAAIKAHPHRRLTFHDILIRRADAAVGGEYQGSGPPVAIVKGTHDGIADQEARISISHDGEYAMAVCMGFDPGTSQIKD